MTIAVSVVVRPSPCLQLLHAGMCAGVMASAVVCADWWASLVCVLSGLLALCCAAPDRNPRLFDISGVGTVQLTVYQVSQVSEPASALASASASASASALHWLAGSTIWPGLLLLRLGGDDGAVQVVRVLPDSVTAAEWRVVALACRAIAARTEIKPQIL